MLWVSKDPFNNHYDLSHNRKSDVVIKTDGKADQKSLRVMTQACRFSQSTAWTEQRYQCFHIALLTYHDKGLEFRASYVLIAVVMAIDSQCAHFCSNTPPSSGYKPILHKNRKKLNTGPSCEIMSDWMRPHLTALKQEKQMFHIWL